MPAVLKGTAITESKMRVRTPMKRNVKENLELYAIMLPTIVLIIIFMYIPMYGIVIAFQDYIPGAPFFGAATKWVGLKHFINFVKGEYFTRFLVNTLRLNTMSLLMGFWVPIAFALILNELYGSRFKKFVQTVSYLPHFISSVVVAGMVLSFVSTDGIINQLITVLGGTPQAWNTNPTAFPWIFTLTGIWQSFGWSSILYLATISAIDPALYEAADLDGAGRWKKIQYITLPHMLPLIAVQLIFFVGGMLNSDTQMILLLYNPATYKTADTIGTFVYRQGLVGGQFSSASAAGLFMSILSFLLVYGSNYCSRKLSDYSLW